MVVAVHPSGVTMLCGPLHPQTRPGPKSHEVVITPKHPRISRTKPVAGASSGSLSGISLAQTKGAVTLSAPMQIVVMLTLLSVLPAIIMSVTPFLRITVVLHFLRQALGTQGTPSNQVLIGLALFLTILIMQRGHRDLSQGLGTGRKRPDDLAEGFEEGSQPLKAFLVKYVREKDVKLFLDVSHTPAPARPSDLGLIVLVPLTCSRN